MQEAYTTKTQTNEKFITKKPIEDKNGRIIVDEQNQIQRWKEYFQELFNRNLESEENE